MTLRYWTRIAWLIATFTSFFLGFSLPAKATTGISCDEISHCSFKITSSTQYADWVIPQGVTVLHVVLEGAAGGNGGNGSAGSQVGKLEGDLTVIAGSKIRFSAGGFGKDATSGGAGGINPAGGFSGGDGGLASVPTKSAGGGGGASVIFFRDQVFVAAGGGGGSGIEATGGGGGGATGGLAGTFIKATATASQSGANRASGLAESFVSAPAGTDGYIEVFYTQKETSAVPPINNHTSTDVSNPQSATDFAIASIALLTALSSAWISPQGQEEEAENLENIETDHLGAIESEVGKGDQWEIWKFAGIDSGQWVIRKLLTYSYGRSLVITRVLTDGSYLRAMFGTFALAPTLLAIGIGHGTLSVSTSLNQLPTLGVTALIALGILDSLAGACGFVTLVGLLFIKFGIHSVPELEFTIALITLGFISPLAAAAIRPWRRLAFTNWKGLWERLADFAIVPVIIYLSVDTVVKSLPSLLRADTTLEILSSQIGPVIVIAALARLLLEETSVRYFPSRLASDHPDDLNEAPRLLQRRAIFIRTALFAAVTASFIGFTWHVAIAAALFAIPQILGLYNERFINSPTLWQAIPGGVPGLVMSFAIGAMTAKVLANHFATASDAARMIFVLAMVPSALISLAKSFGRHPELEDVRWYRRTKWQLFYRISGPTMLIALLHLNNVIF